MNFDEILTFLLGLLGRGEVVNAIGIVVFVVLLAVGTWAVAQLGQHEKTKRLLTVWQLVDDRIAQIVVTLAYGNVDLTAEEAEIELKGLDIDPRMLYLINRIEAELHSRYGVTVDLLEIQERAESIFQNLRAGGKLQI